jgi:serine protease Do
LSEYYCLNVQKVVLVTQVFPDNPAEKAGIQPKDVIVAVDGKPVTTGRELSAAVAGMPVGKEVAVKILRNGKEQSLTVKLAQRSDNEPIAQGKSPSTEALGIRAAGINPETARRFGVDENEKGVLVLEVQPGGKAEQAGMQQGDIVKEVNRAPVQSVEDLKAEFGKAKSGDDVPFLVKRRNSGFVVLKVTK